MNRCLKILFVIISCALIAGCATQQQKYDAEVLTTIGNQSMEGKTYGLFPLDQLKVGKIETQMIASEIVKGLTLTGLRLGELHADLPNYVLLFDYATELGIDAPYEHVFLMIGYAVSDGTQRQIYKVRLKVDSREKNALVILSPAIQSITEKFPNQFQ
jgi:hypothetical protein